MRYLYAFLFTEYHLVPMHKDVMLGPQQTAIITQQFPVLEKTNQSFKLVATLKSYARELRVEERTVCGLEWRNFHYKVSNVSKTTWALINEPVAVLVTFEPLKRAAEYTMEEMPAKNDEMSVVKLYDYNL